MEQLMDNTNYMVDFASMNEEELTSIIKVVDIINSSIVIPFTGCEHCIVACPMNIAILKYFSLYNADLQ